MNAQIGAAQLSTAFLFGGSLLYSSAFAAFLFTALPAEQAGRLLRSAFAKFYMWVIATSVVSSLLYFGIDGLSSIVLGGIAISTVVARQILMPAINRAADCGDKQRFNLLHGVSILLGLAQIFATGFVLLRALA